MTEEQAENSSPLRRILLPTALVLVLIGAVWLGLSLYRAWGAATSLRAHAQAATALMDEDLHDIEPHEAASLLRATRADLLTLHSAARPFLWVAPHLGWVPRWGPTIEAAPILLQAALDLTEAGEHVVESLMPLLQDDAPTALPGAPGPISAATAALADAQPHLARALDAVEEARSAFAQLDPETLPPRLQRWMARLEPQLPLVKDGIRGMLLAPELLGAQEPRTYLVLVQNEDELRATGGFISGVAQITVSEGRIRQMQFEDSYAVDDFSVPYPEPPAALRETMLADLWLFRDSNWSPDFPTAARQAVELFTLSRRESIDGIIALDQQAISLLLRPLGPLEVEGTEGVVTGDNVIQVARRAWAPGDEIELDWWEHRKDIMGSVLEAAVRQLEGGLGRDQMVGLGRAALEALRERHLLIYLEEETAAAALRDLGWDGAVGQPPGDFLLVVDSNVGFNKVNAVVERRLEYAVDLTEPGYPQATLTVRHTHPVEGWTGPCDQEPRYNATYEGMIRRCYYNYLRVYVPSGAELLRATSHPVDASILLSGQGQRGGVVDPSSLLSTRSSTEVGHAVFSTYLVVQPQQALETLFVYNLPAAAVERSRNQWHYHLTIQKQPGTGANPVTVVLRLPEDAQVLEADPVPAEGHQGTLRYELDLQTDRALRVVWE